MDRLDTGEQTNNQTNGLHEINPTDITNPVNPPQPRQDPLPPCNVAAHDGSTHVASPKLKCRGETRAAHARAIFIHVPHGDAHAPLNQHPGALSPRSLLAPQLTLRHDNLGYGGKQHRYIFPSAHFYIHAHTYIHTYSKCYVGFCTPRCTEMESQKKKSYDGIHCLPTINHGARGYTSVWRTAIKMSSTLQQW